MEATQKLQLPSITQSLGSAERAMRALLDQCLRSSNLTFAQWTMLVFTSNAEPTSQELEDRLLQGYVVKDEAAAKQAIATMLSTNLLQLAVSGTWKQTSHGSELFRTLSEQVKGTTKSILCELQQNELEATHRTLLEIFRRATDLHSEREQGAK